MKTLAFYCYELTGFLDKILTKRETDILLNNFKDFIVFLYKGNVSADDAAELITKTLKSVLSSSDSFETDWVKNYLPKENG